MAIDASTAKKIANPAQAGRLARSLGSGKDSRIGNGMAAVLIGMALVADILTLIPFAGDVIGPLFWIAMSIYLWMRGCGFLNVKQLITKVISVAAEMVPAIQAFPTILIGTFIVIALVRAEDKTGVSLMKPGSRGKISLNQAGVRLPQDPEQSSAGRSRNPNMRPLNVGGIRQPRS